VSFVANDSGFLDVFPFLKAVPHEEWAKAQPRMMTFPAKTRIFQKEDAADYGMLLLRGTAQITLIEENGSESVLNVLSAGEVCSLLVLSGLSDRDYPGSLIAETEVDVLFVAKGCFLKWVQAYEPIRTAIFGGLLDSMIRMSELLQARLHLPLDARLASALLRAASEEDSMIYATHQEIAVQIGSVREVVSRALQRYQKEGWVETGRGWIRIIHRDKLETAGLVTRSQKA